MPKIKTHKGTAKRFQLSGSGKVMQTKGMKSHLRRRKSARTSRQFDEMLVTNKTNVKRIKRLMPYA
jgi:large subunit ribosomal protein L35